MEAVSAKIGQEQKQGEVVFCEVDARGAEWKKFLENGSSIQLVSSKNQLSSRRELGAELAENASDREGGGELFC